MVEIVAIVEGQTELTFIRAQLAAHLGGRGAAIWAVLPGRNRKRGGVKDWGVARGDIIRTLKEKRFCTTMFDYYGMPESWPGRTRAKELAWDERAALVEQEIHSDITAALGSDFDPRRFIPYVQLHEFEALVFADTSAAAAVLAPLQNLSEDSLARTLQAIVEAAEHPEAIDDGRETCPSRRIKKFVPGYRKPLNGPVITQRIGLETLRARCAHFDEWVSRLERIGVET